MTFLLVSIGYLLFTLSIGPSSLREKSHSPLQDPVPLWNDICGEAVEHRRSLLRIYRSNPTLDNWSAYYREFIHCKRTLRREKCLGWKRLCSEFSYKTPTAEIWRFIRSYKNHSALTSPRLASRFLNLKIRLSKNYAYPRASICARFLLPKHTSNLQDSSQNPFSWMDDPFSLYEFEHAIDSSKFLPRIELTIRFYALYLLIFAIFCLPIRMIFFCRAFSQFLGAIHFSST